MSWNELSYGEITAASGVERFGAFDYAVPHQWLMEDPEKRRHFCWYYPHDVPRPSPGRRRPSSRPLAYRALARLALRRIHRTGIIDLGLYAKLWAYARPGRGFNPAGIAAVRSWICTYGDLGSFDWLFEKLGIPIPAPPVMDELTTLATRTRNLAA